MRKKTDFRPKNKGTKKIDFVIWKGPNPSEAKKLYDKINQLSIEQMI